MILGNKKLVQVAFPEDQYYKVNTPKNQVILHHTVSGPGVRGDIDWWIATAQRIATAIIIDRDGTPHQCFSSKYWGSHLGIKASTLKAYGFRDYGTRNVALDKGSIGVELDSWGGLTNYKGIWYATKWDDKLRKNVPNMSVPIDARNVQTYQAPYRGFYAFEKYTDAQLRTLKDLLLLWGQAYSIPLQYNEGMWNVSKEAIGGKAGVWSHTSFRGDKNDVHPQPELIDLLKLF